jgi:hypothetical protein
MDAPMTAISNVYTALESFVAAQLPTYKRLANGYAIEANSELILTKGWGLAIGPGTNSNRFVGCKHSTARQVVITLTNQASATEHDLANHKAQELAILEDAYKLRKAIESDPDLATTVAIATWSDDTGIEFLEGDRFRFYRIGLTFNVEYIESN